MQISSYSVISLPPAQHQRVDTIERVQKDVARESGRSSDDRRDNNSLESLHQQAGTQKLRVKSTSSTDAINSNVNNSTRKASDGGLSLATQKALAAFVDNMPSPEQQLGIELAGIDTFA